MNNVPTKLEALAGKTEPGLYLLYDGKAGRKLVGPFKSRGGDLYELVTPEGREHVRVCLPMVGWFRVHVAFPITIASTNGTACLPLDSLTFSKFGVTVRRLSTGVEVAGFYLRPPGSSLFAKSGKAEHAAALKDFESRLSQNAGSAGE